MKRILNMALLCCLAWGLAACDFAGKMAGNLTSEVSKDFASEPEGVAAVLDELIEFAKTDKEKVEFYEFSFRHDEDRPEDFYNGMVMTVIDPANRDKLKEFSWNDSKDRRNAFDGQEVVVSKMLSGDVVEGHDQFADDLFGYDVVKEYLAHYADYCKEALAAAADYKENAYIRSFSIDSGGEASIVVGYRGSSSPQKTFRIAADKLHIVTD